MKSKRSTMTFAIILLFISNSFAQMSKQDAYGFVRDRIVGPDISMVEIFSYLSTKTENEEILVYDGNNIINPFKNAWLFFIDDCPVANWAHGCRYVILDTKSGNYRIYNRIFFPENFKLEYVKEYSPFTDRTKEPIIKNTNKSTKDGSDHLYAVLIGADSQEHQWRGVSVVYNTLLENGYRKENIFLHYEYGEVPEEFAYTEDFDDNGFDDDIDYPAQYEEEIARTFKNMSGELNDDPNVPVLGPGDQLFVYIISHGDYADGHSRAWLPGYGADHDIVVDEDFASYLDNIACSQMIFLFEPCYFGGYVDYLTDFENGNYACNNRMVFSSSDKDHSAMIEYHITDRMYTEYTFYWVSAVRGRYPNFALPWNPDEYTGSFPFNDYTFDCQEGGITGHPGDFNPDINDNNNVQLNEAKYYADYMDTWYEDKAEGFFCRGFGNYSENYKDKPYSSTRSEFLDEMLSIDGIYGQVTKNMIVPAGDYYITGDVIITSGNTLTVEGNVSFTFEDGAQLIVENNAELYISPNAEFTYNNAGELVLQNYCTITIGTNGKLRIKNSNTLNLVEYCTLNINDGSLIIENGAKLLYDECNINLTGLNSNINLKGILELSPYKQFSFNGDGYIIFNSPTFHTNTNASIHIQGNGQSDKKVEIVSSSASIPGSLSSFIIEDCKVLITHNTGRLYFSETSNQRKVDNVKFTTSGSSRTDHQGLTVYKGNNVTIKNSTFENGKYGLYLYHSGTSGPLMVENCTFTNCDYGLRTYHNRVDADNCTFTGNSYGWYASSMVSTSYIDDCTFSGTSSKGIYFYSSDVASLYATGNDFNTGGTGMYFNGSNTAYLTCNTFSGSASYGIYYTNGASLNMQEFFGEYKKNSIGGKTYSIRPYNGKYIYLNNGYNNLIPYSGGKAVNGYLSGYGAGPVILNSLHNRWNFGNTKPVFGTDYNLKTSTYYNNITLKDNTPGSMTCAKGGSVATKDGNEDAPLNTDVEASIINTTYFPETPLDDAVNEVLGFIENTVNPLSNEEAINLLCEILLYELEVPNIVDMWYTGLAYIEMGKLLGNVLVESKKGKAVFDKALKVKAKLLKKNFANDYYNSLFTGVDLANLLHSIGESKKAIKLLEKMLKNANEDDLDYINYVLCQIETEVAIEDGLIAEEEIAEALSSCEYEETESDPENKSGGISVQNNKLNSALVSELEEDYLLSETFENKLSVYPNPITGISQINVNIKKNKIGIIKIYDIQGKIIQQYSLKEGENIVNISKTELKNGIYNVVLYEDGLKLENQKIIVN